MINRLYGTKVPLVLTGHPLENYENIMRLIKELGISDQIRYLGFVSETEMVALYKKAAVLVYPTLFGPTNIPPLEAMILGTPVLCSNLFSMPEQVGDAALLFDPFSIEDMAEKIYRIWNDEALRKSLVQKGYDRIKEITQENYASQWETVIEKTIQRIDKD
jgi:glycosyltransferase involved in cell wall biosynthesis